MPQSLARIIVHMVFSTKNRAPFLNDKEVRKQLEAYMAGTLRKLGSPAIIVGCVEDHAHVLCLQSKNIALAKLVDELKTSSSMWVKPMGMGVREFHWQNGYGAFSVGQSEVEVVRRYIANQEEQHRARTFQGGIARVVQAARRGVR
jgi:REP element-mobilizing transposase RayT